jgi:hypothetical protein
MKLRSILARAICGFVVAASTLSAAYAAEPRPWLCRDKAVFSADKPMLYEVGSRAGRGWQIFFMQFEPGATHDGFEIVSEHRLATKASGKLSAGRYFVVAMHLAGGHWVCHESAETSHPSGEVARICFTQEESSSCRVELTVKQAEGSSSARASTP